MGAVTKHFIDRATERLGYTISQAVELADGLIWAIQNERDDLVEFVARVNRKGCRLFRFRAVNGHFYYALVDTERWKCVTVLPAGFKVSRPDGERVMLKGRDL